MARPVKCGLSYIPFDTDFFNDRKIRRLLKAFGGKGVTVYMFVILEAAKNNGYYLDWDSDYPEDIAEALGQKDKGFSSNLISEIVSFCLKAELFDPEKFSKFGVITSKGLQTRFVAVKETVNRRQYLQEELINEDLIVKRGLTVDNDVLQRETSETIVITPKEKKSKVNKSKEKESKEKNIFNADAFGVKTQTELQPTLELPDCLKTSDFKAAWFDWIDYKKQRRETYKSAGAKALLKKLAEFGPDEAIRKIETAMANNWAGCVFDSPKKQNRNDTSSAISSVAERLKRIESESEATEQ